MEETTIIRHLVLLALSLILPTACTKRYFGVRESPQKMVAFWRDNFVAIVAVNGEKGYPHFQYVKVPFYTPAGELEITTAYYSGGSSSDPIVTRIKTEPGDTWIICSEFPGPSLWKPRFTKKLDDCPGIQFQMGPQKSIYGGPDKFDPAYRPED